MLRQLMQNIHHNITKISLPYVLNRFLKNHYKIHTLNFFFLVISEIQSHLFFTANSKSPTPLKLYVFNFHFYFFIIPLMVFWWFFFQMAFFLGYGSTLFFRFMVSIGCWCCVFVPKWKMTCFIEEFFFFFCM